jgi:hypothetical protein
MNARTYISVAAHPDINLRVKMKPFEFQVGGEASFSLATGDIRVRVEEIPVYLAIPFLKRRVTAGSVGPFSVHVRPFEAKFHASGIDARGMLGKECAEAELHALGNCKAEIEVSGKLANQAVNAAIKTIVED